MDESKKMSKRETLQLLDKIKEKVILSKKVDVSKLERLCQMVKVHNS